MMRRYFHLFCLGIALFPGHLPATVLVKPETVAIQKKETRTTVLKSGITLITRQVPKSGIVSVAVGFKAGSAYLPADQRVLNEMMFSTMAKAARGYSKSKVNALTEKYSIGVGCGGGIEFSSCSMTSLTTYWETALPLLAAVIKKPLFEQKDLDLHLARVTASYRSMSEDPGSWSNDVVNRIYYPKGHPYRMIRDEALAALPKITRAKIVGYHKSVMDGSPPVVVVVSDMTDEEVRRDIERYFPRWPGKSAGLPNLDFAVPSIDDGKTYFIENRDIPTAYMRLKFPAVGAGDPESVASRVMFEILNEGLWDEVRTRRSLSYGVGAGQIQYHAGIGSISVSTSKPKETLDAIAGVIKRLKSQSLTQAEVERFKVVFSTAYFMAQETHGGIAAALLNAYNYFGAVDRLYDFPAELEKVTAEDVRRVANRVLRDMRLGTVYSEKSFKPDWIKEFNSRIR